MPGPQHSKLAPSKAYQWTDCTASVKFIADNDAILPKDTSVYADEGTRAHAYLTWLLKAKAAEAKPDNEEMEKLIQGTRDYIAELFEAEDQLLVDVRAPLFYKPSDYGTLDTAVVGKAGHSYKRGVRAVFHDLKYGAGVSVYAERNKQLAIYAESEIRVLEQVEAWAPDTPLMLVIDQPRDRNDSQRFREWRLTRGELAEFCAKEIEAPAKVILSGGATKFSPGPACKFCRAAGICTAKALEGLTVLAEEDTPIDAIVEHKMVELPKPESLTRDQRQKVLAAKAVLFEWLEAVENQEVAELMAGAQAHRFKLVAGKSNRRWKDEQQVGKLLLERLQHNSIYPPIPPEIVSPAQAEKLLKATKPDDAWWQRFNALTEKPEGKPTLVPIEDKRPALSFNPTEGLTDLGVNPQDLI